MDCRSLLEVMPLTQLIEVVDGTRVTYGEVSRVATGLPNCVLEKRVSVVKIAKSVDCTDVIEIHLGVAE